MSNVTMVVWWSNVHDVIESFNWFVDDLPSPLYVISFCVGIAVFKFLHLWSSPEEPKITYLDGCEKNMVKEVLQRVSMLNEPYRPPPLWGRSGHVQTAAYGLLGHASLLRSYDRRVALKLPDGSTTTFDIFEPINSHPSGKDVTLALVPGIANSSESNYIRTCVHYAQEKGLRCAVLNHLGALPDVKLTGNRIFSYGGTDEVTSMMLYLFKEYPTTKFVNIGFSMGGNLTTLLLLRLPEEHRHRILIGLSVCQGYSATVSAPMYHDWENGRRAYNYIITENMKRLLRRNYEQAVQPHVSSGLIDEQRLWASTAIVAFDENYNRKIFGYDSLETFYDDASCLPLLETLQIPMVFLNAEDDPIIPRALWEPVQSLASKKNNIGFLSTRHGGHLGFLEGDSFSPCSVTWLDRFIVELTYATISVID